MSTLPEFLEFHTPQNDHDAGQLASALLAGHVEIEPKYFYDDLGSKLFASITALPEYYPTRTEAQILHNHPRELAQWVPAEHILIDLGAGDCKKAASLFPVIKPARYIAVDISSVYLREVLTHLQRQYPQVRMTGVGLDFSKGLALPQALELESDKPLVVFYPGSSIGNFTPQQALHFTGTIAQTCAHHPDSGLLIGVDLAKDTNTLQAAYDDALGVTAAFNKNMLLHINRLIDANFDIRQWAHVAHFNTDDSRIEMHLEALSDVTVQWRLPANGQRVFKKGERIHSENSYKWRIDQFSELLEEAGFGDIRMLTDPEKQFAVYWAQVRKPANRSRRSGK
ncbi:MAG TPA: L-histidine N(alpha)-methyltransferase [Limnobacter sp.]|uniref:L-histidine N(alpha)-methyltransferase n=1 Tax=Limnobacter sp. TaxID=2003368 RepID=UPI002E36ED08|nr:L-histidine N(alpha)-methyltransferase [Limnobacter sp.]HEX5487050.1 L-histidine N(alpha)-methyltransferase [Limnobacter sp.]